MFRMIAVIAAMAIGDPSKYWSICGEALRTCFGNKTRAIVKIIGMPIT